MSEVVTQRSNDAGGAAVSEPVILLTRPCHLNATTSKWVGIIWHDRPPHQDVPRQTSVNPSTM